jgi:hypothetical protein
VRDRPTLEKLWILRTLLMSRILITALVLAALSVTSANGLPVSRAKSHRTASAKATPHKTQTEARHATSQTKAHRASPEEVGRAAGLKIRRDLARHPIPPPATHRQARPHTYPAYRASRANTVPRMFGTSRQGREARSRQTFSPPRLAQASSIVKRPPSRSIISPVLIGPVPVPDSTPETAQAIGEEANALPTRAQAPPFEYQGPAADSATTEPAVPAEEPNIADLQPDPVTASLHFKRGVMPPPLKGSHASLERQNERTEAEGLERIEDEDDLADRIARRMLVPVPVSLALTINGNLPVNHRYCRPWTARFLTDLAKSHAAEFHRPLEVSSAVRTVAYQKRLMGINGNAAAAEGDIVSPHLTGATIDIAKSPLSREEIGWMRSRLLALEDAGKIDVEEEFQQSCFHITVYKSYAPAAPATTRKPRQRRPNPPNEIAAKGL